jgi:phosphotriesterase-related protein
MQTMVETVLGPVPVERLGRTLMHEHLQIAAPGWQFDTLEPPMPFAELVRRCVDHVEELKAAGFASMVDPCPIDMGRDVELMCEVASRTGFNVICSTGFYHGEVGAAAHWRVRLMVDPDARRRFADLLIRELTEGIGETGIRPGVIKVATGRVVTAFEEAMLDAAAMASLATGAPVTTHTDAVHGELQVDSMAAHGVDPARIVVGHCCGSNDFAYHSAILDRGAYIGFDRFGMEDVNSDEQRVASLARLLDAGRGDRIVISHDCVLCFRGLEDLRPPREPHMLRVSQLIEPMLRERGFGDGHVEQLLRDNPRRFFSGTPD